MNCRALPKPLTTATAAARFASLGTNEQDDRSELGQLLDGVHPRARFVFYNVALGAEVKAGITRILIRSERALVAIGRDPATMTKEITESVSPESRKILVSMIGRRSPPPRSDACELGGLRPLGRTDRLRHLRPDAGPA
jgi:hypothetical protein